MVGLSGLGGPEQGWRKGPWTAEEDKLLTEYVSLHGEGRWSSVARSAGLNRSGKSSRLRWVNYLRPGLKKGQLTPQEESIIIELHSLWGNKWSTIARCLPGRTDNEIKNYWRTHFKNKAKTSLSQEKLKARALRRQQLNKKQQQQQQVYMSNVEFQQEESDYKVSLLAQSREEMVFMYPNLEDQCFPQIFQDCATLSDTIAQEGLWGGLWNMDDVHAYFNNNVTMSK